MSELELAFVQAQIDPLHYHVQETRVVSANVMQVVVIVVVVVVVADSQRRVWVMWRRVLLLLLFAALAHAHRIKDDIATLNPKRDK